MGRRARTAVRGEKKTRRDKRSKNNDEFGNKKMRRRRRRALLNFAQNVEGRRSLTVCPRRRRLRHGTRVVNKKQLARTARPGHDELPGRREITPVRRGGSVVHVVHRTTSKGFLSDRQGSVRRRSCSVRFGDRFARHRRTYSESFPGSKVQLTRPRSIAFPSPADWHERKRVGGGRRKQKKRRRLQQ